MTIPAGHRFEATQALRVDVDQSPADRAGENLQAIARAAIATYDPPQCRACFRPCAAATSTCTNFRNRAWKPAERAAGSHRCARSTISLAMIDRHYGHLARDGREHTIRLLETYRAAEPVDVHTVDARWTANMLSRANGDNGKAAEQARP
jgi:hypothetical protein